MPLLSEKPLFIYISQSGETADSRAVLVETNKLGYKSLTVTNVAGSTLSREEIIHCFVHAGLKLQLFQTSIYSSNCCFINLISSCS